MQVSLGRPFRIRALSDALGLTSGGCLKIPIWIFTGDQSIQKLESIYSGHCTDDSHIVLAIYLEYWGDPFPVNSTIPFCLPSSPPLFKYDQMNATQFYGMVFSEDFYEGGETVKQFYKLPIATQERRRSSIWQESDPVIFDMASEFGPDDWEGLQGQLDSLLYTLAWFLVRDEEKFFEFSYTKPFSDKRFHSEDLPSIFRRREVL